MFSINNILLEILLLSIVMMASASEKKHVIVFGGNGFIGAASVRKMITALPNFDITIVNRGSWPWDTKDSIKPYVRHFKCDRYGSSIGYACPEFVKFIDSLKEIHAVVDFSAFESHVIVDAVKLLTRKQVGVYIYISSDSIYEVCNKTHEEATLEEDAIRPDDPAIREKLNRMDTYGHKKFEGEEILLKMYEHNGPPYVFLRLPDVIGPRDSTNRWWMYQLWIKLSAYTRQPVRIPRSVGDEPLGFVYVNDVANCILNIITTSDKTIYNNAYNLAFVESFSLKELLEMIQSELELKALKYVYDEEKDREYYLFPSVTKGPISVKKAVHKLGWTSADIIKAVKNTVKFYEEAMQNRKYKKEIKSIVEELRKEVFVDNTLFNAAFDELYGYNVHSEEQKHDEL